MQRAECHCGNARLSTMPLWQMTTSMSTLKTARKQVSPVEGEQNVLYIDS
jgi:hypothetical protein